jgi:RHS repeat-associated protein
MLFPQKHTENLLLTCSPFGTTLYGRNWSSEKYRYGFNGIEKDDEVKGQGNSYNFMFRFYDTRLGRFLSVDPLVSDFAMSSSYAFAMNSPLKFIDIEGAEIYITGTASDEFINLLATRTGLEFSKDANGKLSYATTIVNIPSPLNSGILVPTTIPKIVNLDGKFVSEKLRKEVIMAINGVDTKGEKLVQVNIIAHTSEEISKISGPQDDVVLFDAFDSPLAAKQKISNFLDMSDFQNIGDAPILQAALLGHIISERSFSTNFDKAHAHGKEVEQAIIQEKYPKASMKSDNLSTLTSLANRPLDKFGYTNQISTYLFSYGVVEFLLMSNYEKTESGGVKEGSVNIFKPTGVVILSDE